MIRRGDGARPKRAAVESSWQFGTDVLVRCLFEDRVGPALRSLADAARVINDEVNRHYGTLAEIESGEQGATAIALRGTIDDQQVNRRRACRAATPPATRPRGR